MEKFIARHKYAQSKPSGNIPQNRSEKSVPKYFGDIGLSQTGNKFKGNWKNNRTGFEGTLTCKNGNKFYNVQINYVEKQWGGVMYDKEDNQFLGAWTDNWKEFKGIAEYKNGSFLDGKWTDDFKKFEGKVFSKNLDDCLKGTWTKNGNNWVGKVVISEITSHRFIGTWTNDWANFWGEEIKTLETESPDGKNKAMNDVKLHATTRKYKNSLLS